VSWKFIHAKGFWSGEGKPHDFGIGEEVVKEWADLRETFRSTEIEEKYASLHCTRQNDECFGLLNRRFRRSL
jgi:hypothetical protein